MATHVEATLGSGDLRRHFFYAKFPSIEFTQNEIEVLNFRGVDGNTFRSLGVKSEPWKLQVRTDNLTEKGAWEELLLWRDFVDKGTQQLILSGEDFDDRETQVMVIGFKPGFGDFPPVRIEKGVGYAHADGVRWICSGEFTLVWVILKKADRNASDVLGKADDADETADGA